MKTHNVYQNTEHVNNNKKIICGIILRGKLCILFLFFSLEHFVIPVVLFDLDNLSSECS